ncbi:hypothetical protein DDB_G0281781 [Dictyostelium discoideum AX4]|uniref:Transmembrane protein n=1 Tax=Dictyostelium discoideum TaxID=44689 RepID=Q54TF3_DICDI|nr:hypothetical protein DDB_G0281781 [Dictyostelium discoideum AX4]EAL66652.1 hypothetical protein DDB_G0281781 [Dictyostelium discoideum AX4]|eukprot:XP_640638.1 hypothetical protein DDB_G0281781 [Dictyostelium discoideum AX4]
MKIFNLLVVLLSIVNISLGQITFQKYVDFNGYNQPNCGASTEPCKSIEYVINQIKSYSYEQFSIEILLGRGTHHSLTPTNLYGLNITIGAANPGESVQLLASSSLGTAQFTVDHSNYYDIIPTNIVFRDLTVTCDLSYTWNGLLLQSNINSYQNLFLNVKTENVIFSCANSDFSYFSVSNNYNSYDQLAQKKNQLPYGSESYSSSESNSESNSESYSSEFNSESSGSYSSESSGSYSSESSGSESSGSYSSESYSSESYSSESYSPESYSSESSYNSENDNNNYYQDLYMEVVDQVFGVNSYPYDNINISFAFNNCQFNYQMNNQYPVVLNANFDFTIDLKITNSIFNTNYIFNSAPLVQLYGGSLTMDNVSIVSLSFVSNGTNSLFYLVNARVSFNKVSISGSISGPFIKAVNCIVTANQFNIISEKNYEISYHLITLTESFAYFENSTIVLSVKSDVKNYFSSNIAIFNPVNSELYLFSNRISSNGSSIVYSQSSDVSANNNQFQYAPYSVNSYQLVQCDYGISRFYGDYQFTSYSDSCQAKINVLSFWNTNANLLEIIISYLSGVLSIVLVFVTMFTISAIGKCCRRKRKAIQKLKKEKEEEAAEAAKSLLSINDSA